MQPASVVASLTFLVTIVCGFVLPDFNLVLQGVTKLLSGKYHETAPTEPTFEEYKANLINLNKVVPHHYVVIFKEDLSQSQVEQYTQWLQVEYNNMLTIAEAAPRGVQVLKSLNFSMLKVYLEALLDFYR